MTFDTHSRFADEGIDQSSSDLLTALSIGSKIQNKHFVPNLCLLPNRKIQVYECRSPTFFL